MTLAARTFLAGLLLTLAALAGLLGSAQTAAAHASLVRTEPAEGAVLAQAPAALRLTFSEPVSPLTLRLVAPDGASIPLETFVLRDATLEIAVPPGLADGTYALSWRVVSEDGHPVGGASVFSIGAPGTVSAAVGADDRTVQAAIWLLKLALYGGLFLGTGGVFFRRWIGGGSARQQRFERALLIAGLGAAALSLGAQGLDALGEPLAALLSPDVWKAGLSTSYGRTALIAGLALAATLAATRLEGTAGRLLSLAGLLGAGAALAASGHASAAQPQWATRSAVFLHAVGIALWAGALPPLAGALGKTGGPAALGRFSRLIPWAVLPLAGAGLFLAAVQVRSLDGLWSTAYGRVFLVKLVLLAALFGLAAWNRLRLTKPALAGEGGALQSLRRSVAAEIGLVVLILATAAVWRFTPPPRALAEAAGVPASVHIHSDKAMAEVTVTPGRAGPVRVAIVPMTGDFSALTPQQITLVVANPQAGIEPIRRPAQRQADGSWAVDGLTLPVAGRWTVRLDLLISDFEMVKLEDGLDIRP